VRGCGIRRRSYGLSHGCYAARAAVVEGVIDRAAANAPSAIDGADLVVLGGPATACLDLLDGLAGPWSASLDPEALITDVASTKAVLHAHADALGSRYVGGHPMAGLDAAGYAASTATLFVDRPWVIVRGAGARDNADVVAALARLPCPAGRDGRNGHDAAVAAVSHLPTICSPRPWSDREQRPRGCAAS
jgi:prephenate dehydrogenase